MGRGLSLLADKQHIVPGQLASSEQTDEACLRQTSDLKGRKLLLKYLFLSQKYKR